MARYGKDERLDKCEDDIKEAVCVEQMITHMYETTRALFKDTVDSENFFFFHDALSVMTAGPTMDWMKKRNIKTLGFAVRRTKQRYTVLRQTNGRLTRVNANGHVFE